MDHYKFQSKWHSGFAGKNWSINMHGPELNHIFLFFINSTFASQKCFAFMSVASLTPPVMLVSLSSSLKTATQGMLWPSSSTWCVLENTEKNNMGLWVSKLFFGTYHLYHSGSSQEPETTPWFEQGTFNTKN